MDWLLETIIKFPQRSIGIVLAIVLVAGGYSWWQFVWQNPQRVFEDMLARNLSTLSMTKTVVAAQGEQSVDQTVRLQMGGVNAADWLVAVKQSGSSVTTESIGTPTGGYIRYTNIATAQKQASGKAYDFSPVLNIWAKSDGKTDASLDDLFSQTLLDITSAPVPPVANLPADKRENLLAYNRDEKVFTPDYSKVKHETFNGRPVYTYDVSVRLGAYVRMMMAFAHDLGLKSLDTVDPNQYANLAPITFSVSVDPVSHQMVKVAYAQSGFSQTYGDWGLAAPIQIPAHGISTTELQGRLQSLGTQKT